MSAFARALGAFRIKNPVQVQAAVDAQLARVDLDFDAVDAAAAWEFGRLRAIGVLEDRRKSPRNAVGGSA